MFTLRPFPQASESLLMLDVKMLFLSERPVQLHFIWKKNILIVLLFTNIKYKKKHECPSMKYIPCFSVH